MERINPSKSPKNAPISYVPKLQAGVRACSKALFLNRLEPGSRCSMSIPVGWLWLSWLVLSIPIRLYVAVLRAGIVLAVVLLASIAVAILVFLLQPVMRG